MRLKELINFIVMKKLTEFCNRYWLIIIIGVFGGFMQSDVWLLLVVVGIIYILIDIFILDKKGFGDYNKDPKEHTPIQELIENPIFWIVVLVIFVGIVILIK